MLTLRCRALDNAGFTKHCFTTRKGGVSEGFLAETNLSFSREDKQKVTENYNRIAKAVGLSGNFRLTWQEHTDNIDVVTAASGFVFSDAPVDGLVTNRKDICLTAFVADCVPVLLADPKTKSIAAVHSGWRGTAKGITSKAVKLMRENYGADPRDIIAAIGPCIGKCCYEVGEDVFEQFGVPEYFTKKPDGKYMLDLNLANKSVLLAAGLSAQNIHTSYECTFCKSDIYYSHRATNGRRGNLAAMIEL